MPPAFTAHYPTSMSPGSAIPAVTNYEVVADTLELLPFCIIHVLDLQWKIITCIKV